ncbi:GNAT family N-acetyltransferase [Haloarchaeobius sp. DFWS5]|uniref:GNAT family N-acetyltransferase n=1 Tax=Haloarchaeobius sp. DFWS5 TaxID=3446114 RepID=UPI003EBA2CE9
MSRDIFPTQLETDRLLFERFSHETVDPYEFYEFVQRDEWQDDATEHMPWFRLARLDQVAGFVDVAEQQWADRERARYLLRSKDEDGAIVGTTSFVPEWEKRYATSDVVLSSEFWGRGYGPERASTFVELTFETFDLDAYCTSCAGDNEQSRRMIEKVVDRYGGRYEGLLRNFGSVHPDGTVTDQHRFSITREEYEAATAADERLAFEVTW